MYNSQDLEQFNSLGIAPDQVDKQIESVKRGFPYLTIITPATKSKGIRYVDEVKQRLLIDKYKSSDLEISRFVPSSGAATRMFKELYEAVDSLEVGKSIAPDSPAGRFISEIFKFPFYDDLKNLPEFNSSDNLSLLKLLLYEEGLDYGSMPKGLLKFHRYTNYSRTAFEEQLTESVKYATQTGDKAKLMLTVSEEHLDLFIALYNELKKKFQRERGVEINVEFTLQKKSTNTVAVGSDGFPFRNADGSILFRPGGHGALIGNLQEMDSDIIFIKNIDNVIREELLEDTVVWKQTIAGMLIETRERIFSYLNRLDGEFDETLNKEIIHFLKSELYIEIPDLPLEILTDFLYAKLNRPIRICGMVRNEGEPGGGPYIVVDNDGSTSLQILESAQLDKSNHNYDSWMRESTHFNPVDLVCSIYDYKGKKFNLQKFIDLETGFISEKSLQGRSLMALELPGLWNGAMSNWNTVFVEVPVSTFNPVKTVNDLLRPQHIGEEL